MPQNPLAATVARNSGGTQVALLAEASTGDLFVTHGGKSSSLNATAAKVVKTGPGRVSKIIIVSAGTTGGAFTINDAATTGGATAANAIWSLPQGGTNNLAGAVFDLDFPFTNGLVVSAVPTGGSPQISISYS